VNQDQHHLMMGFEPFQPETVGDHKNTTEGHCPCSQHGVEKTQCRSRDQDHIVEKCPEQVLLDGL
jgi:hypothetical protein